MDNVDVFATPPPGGAFSEWGRIIGILASLEACVKTLEKTLQRIEMVMDTNFRTLNDRDTQQGSEIQSLSVRVHTVTSDLSSLVIEVDKQGRVHEVETTAQRNDLSAAIESRKTLAARVDSVLEITTQLNNRVRKLEDMQEQCKTLLVYVTPQPGESKSALLKLVERVDTMWPWMQGIMWALPIAGGVLVLAVAGAILWAIAQSGAGLP